MIKSLPDYSICKLFCYYDIHINTISYDYGLDNSPKTALLILRASLLRASLAASHIIYIVKNDIVLAFKI